ncbi:unnamed protein product [Macrosiphum euphorbiae]|uniref:Uncharacterized protein n=1 Tax=Macrosiphum euphorbiae TaxID=13131 RepID=A0AAV0XCG7_9HEMI|nr:unnamed protein product [Macrosiphum euphorbiae]
MQVSKKNRTSPPPKTNSVSSNSACSEDSWSNSETQPSRSPSPRLSMNNIPAPTLPSSSATSTFPTPSLTSTNALQKFRLFSFQAPPVAMWLLNLCPRFQPTAF